MPRRRTVFPVKSLFAAVAPFALAACSASRPPAPAVTAAPAGPPAANMETPEAALDAAEADVERALGGPGREADAGTKLTGKKAGPEYETEKPKAPESPCVTACRALESMERVTARLCSVAGDGDARCTTAKARVEKATGRVHAACPACTAK
jgi:hypothetical protein